MRSFRVMFLMLMAMVLSSCAETQLASHLFKRHINKTEEIAQEQQSPNQGTFKVGKPYRAAGKTYTPRETYSYSETGIASWYGKEFHGRRTANGEKFDKNELTAAHRTLQMPSLVRVTNLENGRSVVVRINDRGPFARGRVIDVSQKAASLLGFVNKGTARVRLDLLAEESKAAAMKARSGGSTAGMEIAANERQAPVASGFTPVSYESASAQPKLDIPGHVKDGAFFPDPVVGQEPVRPTSLYVQVGSFSQVENARTLADQIKDFGQAQIQPAMIGGRQMYRVRLGPIAAVPQADRLLERLAQAGHRRAITVVGDNASS